jgi:hypothetical protein
MKKKLKLITSSIFFLISLLSIAQKKDTIAIAADKLVLKNLKLGKSTYVLFNKKSSESPAERITIVKINVTAQTYNNRSDVTITQSWERDTILHTSHTIFNAKNFSTVEHTTFWKKSGVKTKFDFETKKIFDYGKVIDSLKIKTKHDFEESFNKYNLNWHSDLVVLTLLPYKENTVFKINFYDPGFGKAKEVFYTIVETEYLTNSSGKKIKCWIMIQKEKDSYQKFWISQDTKEVLKQEDFFNNSYRYKIKLSIY